MGRRRPRPFPPPCRRGVNHRDEVGSAYAPHTPWFAPPPGSRRPATSSGSPASRQKMVCTASTYPFRTFTSIPLLHEDADAVGAEQGHRPGSIIVRLPANRCSAVVLVLMMTGTWVLAADESVEDALRSNVKAQSRAQAVLHAPLAGTAQVGRSSGAGARARGADRRLPRVGRERVGDQEAQEALSFIGRWSAGGRGLDLDAVGLASLYWR